MCVDSNLYPVPDGRFAKSLLPQQKISNIGIFKSLAILPSLLWRQRERERLIKVCVTRNFDFTNVVNLCEALSGML